MICASSQIHRRLASIYLLWNICCLNVHGFAIVQSVPTITLDRRTSTTLVSPSPTKRLESSRLGSIIDASDTWGNIAGLTGAAVAGQTLGERTKIGKLLGPPVSAMAISFVLASIGVLSPGGTAASKFLQVLCLQLATPLILLGADLRGCASRCGPLLVSFLYASAATIIACLIGWLLCRSMLCAALGRDGLIIAAALLAKNVGGGLNYVAVTQALNASPNAVAAGLCVDNIFALVYFPITNALSSGLPDLESDSTDITVQKSDESITLQKTTLVLFISSVLLSLSERLGGKSAALPLCSVATVLFTSIVPNSWMGPLRETSEMLGTSFLYLFFATAGAPGIRLAETVKASAVPLGVFLSLLYTIHGLILAGLNQFLGGSNGQLCRQRLLVASSAAIGGPATSVALAKANRWKSLEIPAVLVGNLGYAIASFIGLAYYSIFR
ncbi:unnamed protein product [Cylindrotheca closterium]|uniref:Uncharacterized protein n=1 Tax=Cylindrotheca closterium TaxID=2856 RepID=A0AAD2FDS8_9STRA|nr:unnamed protein product [Cylindrotheca closterium]